MKAFPYRQYHAAFPSFWGGCRSVVESKDEWKKGATELEISGSIFHKLLINTNKSTNASSPLVTTLSSYKSDLFRPIIHLSCMYPLTQWSLLIMPNVSRQKNRICTRTQQKHNLILPMLNLKHGFSVFKCGKHRTGFLQFNNSSSGIIFTETSFPPLASLIADSSKASYLQLSPTCLGIRAVSTISCCFYLYLVPPNFPFSLTL